jgi:hypothetical protein
MVRLMCVLQQRRHCVLITADPIRAVLTVNNLVLFVPPGGDTVMEILEKHMAGTCVGMGFHLVLNVVVMSCCNAYLYDRLGG